LAVQPVPGFQQEVTSIVPALRNLPPDARRSLEDILSVRRYRKDAYVFSEGDEGSFVCFVVDGGVRTSRMTPDGVEHLLCMLHRGDVFGLSGFFEPGTHTATARTTEPSTIAFVPNAALRSLAQRRADIAWALLRLLGQRLRDSQEHMAELSGRDASHKLAAALLRLAEENGVPAGQTLVVAQHFTHRELAQLIGCSRETVTRVLREFRQDRSVDLDAEGRLTVHPRRLQRYIA